jgi:hypothetical protein
MGYMPRIAAAAVELLGMRANLAAVLIFALFTAERLPAIRLRGGEDERQTAILGRHRPPRKNSGRWLEAVTPASTLAGEFAKAHGRRVAEVMRPM